MYGSMQEKLRTYISELRHGGLYKSERALLSKQSSQILVADNTQTLNLCANNYLGLASHPEIIRAAHEALDRWGYGLSSVRFICGTQEIHKELEARLSHFLGTEDTILYGSCFDANGGLFETLLSDEDAVISDALNHASIIDGIRLSKAKRYRYRNNDMCDLEAKLKLALSAKHRLIATDGVFSMDGTIANLFEICQLAEQYDAMVMIDDSHAVGFIGPTGRGTHEYHNVIDRVDIITGTLGKALGGAGGGYTSGRKEIIDFLRQRSRPYLFSNSVAPPVVAASLRALELITESTQLRDQLELNTRFFRCSIEKIGLETVPGEHPIVPIMLGDASIASAMADALLKKGVYVVGFSYPVVPRGMARIRTQISAAHSLDELSRAVDAFTQVKEDLIQNSIYPLRP
ncbi:2-amino-3-ketobutyrate coenzyme A ligase [Bythopirellula goksoeyrii]|uniref:2-amino-3-ketobutyrate coenzyme A ligase n=2 Tax=Bythopirellula goksoeyrii TaxID=1400387 RepID=A0A5B9QF66_9BACT|nr:2-amino-3-ketobutyrate coenzyme A ligase [Bythopirellula goksoeyrii]